jgi:hypothetical protein
LACFVAILAIAGVSMAEAQSYEKAATLSVAPADALTSSGNQGGPFNPASRQYSVANTGDGTLAWTAVSNQPWVSVQMAPTGNGTKLMVGSQFTTSGTVSIPLSLYRGPDTAAGDGPSAITAFVTYDTDVLQFQGVTQSATLADWYDKSLAAGETTPGRISVVIFGINRYEITTYDNQVDGGEPTDRMNPFPLGSLRFSIVGGAGTSTGLGVTELVMTDADVETVANLSFQQGLFSASAIPGGQTQFFTGPGVSTVSLNSTANSLTGGQHTATVTFSGNGGTATRSVALTVIQSCTTPAAPGQIQASDGTFSDRVQVTWGAVSGATQYQVYRSVGTDPTAAQAVSGWITGTSYNDTSAAAPSGGGSGCSSSSSFTYYNYWVRAQNACGTSNYSATNSGYRGASAKSAKSGALVESALPAAELPGGLFAAEPSAPLALRLASAERIAPYSLWARVEAFAGATATWEPQWSSDGKSVWVVLTPEELWTPGEVVTVRAGATTVSGKPVNAAVTRFQISVASGKSGATRISQPISGVDYVADADETISEAVLTRIDPEEAVPAFAEAVGEPLRIGPAQVFGAPQRVWLPVPADTNPDQLVVYYYHDGGADSGWYQGEKVEGWLVPDSLSRLDLEGETYVGILVQYGGTVQLGMPEGRMKPSEAAVASLGRGRELAGDLAVLAVALSVLLWRGRRSGGRT